VNEFARFVTADLCQHHRQEGIGSDIERNAKEGVGTTLIELTTELSAARIANSAHIELEQAMARWQSHLVHFRHVPSAYDMATGIWVIPEGFDKVLNLVDVTAIRCRP